MAKIELEECPRPDDEDEYMHLLAESTPGRRIAFWWQKVPGCPSMLKLADRIDAELKTAYERGKREATMTIRGCTNL